MSQSLFDPVLCKQIITESQVVLLIEGGFVFENLEQLQVLGMKAVVEDSSFLSQAVSAGMDQGSIFQLLVPTTVRWIELEQRTVDP